MDPAGWYDPPEALAPLQDMKAFNGVISEDKHLKTCPKSRKKIIMVVFILFTRAASHTEPPAVSNQLHAVLVHPHQTDWVNIGENATVESAGSHLSSQNKLNSHPSPILSWKSHKLKKSSVCWPCHPCWRCCSCTLLLHRTRQSVPPQNALWRPPTHWGAARSPPPAELCVLFLTAVLAETGGSGRSPQYTAPPTTG